jgi:hypothetical protein
MLISRFFETIRILVAGRGYRRSGNKTCSLGIYYSNLDVLILKLGMIVQFANF